MTIIQPLKAVVKETILYTLEYYGGNRTRTAEALGLSIRALRDHLNRYRAQGEIVPGIYRHRSELKNKSV